MIIYFASTGGGDYREKLLLRKKSNRLFSFYFHGKDKRFYNQFILRINYLRKKRNE